jgi:peptide/nickel transport system permease protein
MVAYIFRRLLYSIPLILGVTLIVFMLFDVVGGNPAYRMLGKNASPKEIKEMEHQLGLDQPLLVRYGQYLGQLARLDFGRSWSTRQKISVMIKEGIVPSLSLAVPAFIFGTILAIFVSLIAAFYRNRWPDRILVIISVMAMSVSMLVYIIAGQYVLSFMAGLFPISGYETGFRGIPYLILPGLLWVAVSLGGDVRFFRTVILDEAGREYAVTAQAKGLSAFTVMTRHVLKNALIPIITVLGMSLPALVTGSLLLENFFGIPGLGNMSIMAINDSDFPVIKAMTFFGALIYMAANLLSDLLYSLADPRVRLE